MTRHKHCSSKFSRLHMTRLCTQFHLFSVRLSATDIIAYVSSFKYIAVKALNTLHAIFSFTSLNLHSFKPLNYIYSPINIYLHRLFVTTILLTVIITTIYIICNFLLLWDCKYSLYETSYLFRDSILFWEYLSILIKLLIMPFNSSSHVDSLDF